MLDMTHCIVGKRTVLLLLMSPLIAHFSFSPRPVDGLVQAVGICNPLVTCEFIASSFQLFASLGGSAGCATDW